ncbi:hypothetical protein GCM10022289_20910 [Pedobacter jeongneungensis]|uniref:Uncharacterized protein n=1 Tax=Pedobacter jeongneungensis TaxID=947309 RepID=A0ABP8BD42_9SPHI
MADAFKNLLGATYPSVRTDYYGYNVALTIPAVEAFLDLEAVAMFKVYKKQGHTFIDNLAFATELGELKSNFKWVDIKETDEKVINAILLGDYLFSFEISFTSFKQPAKTKRKAQLKYCTHLI